MAIIVSSSPAFARYLKLHVAESSFFKSLRSWTGRFGDSYGSGSGNSLNRFKVKGNVSEGSRQRQDRYLELNQTTRLGSDSRVQGGNGSAVKVDDGAIIRTVNIDQESHPYSMV